VGAGNNKGFIKNKGNSVMLNILGKDIKISNIKDADLVLKANQEVFTINSLAYNLNTGLVEDLTGEGKKDINYKTLRVLIPPKEKWKNLQIKDINDATLKKLKSNPSSVLDAIRLASKYNLGLSKHLVDAILEYNFVNVLKNKKLNNKIFRALMTGPSPERALGLLMDLNLLDAIIKLPNDYCSWKMDQNTPHHDLTVWEHTLTAIENLQEIIKNKDISKENIFALNTALLLHDTGKLDPKIQGTKKSKGKSRTTYYNHESSSVKIVEKVLSKFADIDKREILRIQKLIKGSSRVNPNYIPHNEKCNLTNKTLSKFIKYMKDDWMLAIFMNMADATSKKKNQLKDFDFTYYADMINKIRSLGPKKVINTKPLLSGDEIIKIINKEPGEWASHIITKLLEWQFKNPKSTAEDARGFVLSFKNNV